jgi:hypothetical protein
MLVASALHVVTQVEYKTYANWVQTFLLYSHSFVSYEIRLLHNLSALSRLVVQAALRLAPRWRFSVRVNQRKFNVVQGCHQNNE